MTATLIEGYISSKREFKNSMKALELGANEYFNRTDYPVDFDELPDRNRKFMVMTFFVNMFRK